ncbi:MAG: T9SS type A sorting domain-containing protein [Actinobacteria bacterium]|nr:T9SS type A sorting domain-containing protein [Actinomycetota bacterium]
MDIFNVTGQLVRTLCRGEMRDGFHTVTWNGADESGQAVPAGVYFYRLTGNNGIWQETKKMILIK